MIVTVTAGLWSKLVVAATQYELVTPFTIVHFTLDSAACATSGQAV